MELEITLEELLAMSGPKRVIDIRNHDSFVRGSVPGAENIPEGELDLSVFAQKPEVPVFLVCQSGIRSLELAEEAASSVPVVKSVAGGYIAWLRMELQRMQQDETERKERRARAEKSIITTYRKDLWTPFTRALREYRMIQDGDRIAVCISGGKDSMLMAKLFQELKKHGTQNFEVEFLIMDPGYNELNYRTVTQNAELLGIPVHIFHTEIFDFVADQERNPCYLCARMRRGYLYSEAQKLGCNKIALGHHYDDVIETILMGMLWGGQIQTMMPKLHSTNYEGMELIRPLYLIRERDIIRWREYNHLHFIQCACRLTESCASCGGTEKGSKRAEIKALIHQLAQQDSDIEARIFRSVENVNMDTVIGWKKDGVRHSFLDEYDAGTASEE